MLKIGNCYLPLAVFALAELRAGLMQLLLLVPWVSLLCCLCRGGGAATWAVLICYTAGMFTLQRRLASGLPWCYASLRSWRTSPHTFRQTSFFLRCLREKKHVASAEGYGTRPVAVITGGERGIGQQVVEQLLREGIDVLLCCPFAEAAAQTIAELQSRIPGSRVSFVKLNLNDEGSVRESAAAVLRMTPRIDLLINNAGIVNITGYRANKRGNEVVLAINFLGHVLLTELLLDRITASGPSRIVNVASLLELNACLPGPCATPLDALVANCDPDSPNHSSNYGLSKLLMLCYTRDLAQRLKGTDTAAVALHPGVVLTDIYHRGAKLMKVLLRTVFKFPGEGAEVVLHCAMADMVQSGSFYADCTCFDSLVSPLALDAEENARLRRVLLRYFGLDGAPPDGALSLPEAAASVVEHRYRVSNNKKINAQTEMHSG